MVNKKGLVVLCAMSTIVFWSSAFICNKIGLQHLGTGDLAFYRYFWGSCFFVIFALFGKIQLPKIADIPRLFACGFFGVSLYNILLYTGQKSIPAGTASLLTNTAPIFTAVLSIIVWKERLSWQGWAGMLISIVGVILIVLGKHGTISLQLGALFALGAAISISIYFIIQRPLYKHYSSIEIIAYTIWAGDMLLILFTTYDTKLFLELPIQLHGLIMYLGVFPGAIGYLTWAIVSKEMPAAKAAPLLYLIPVSAFGLSFYFLEEIPTKNTFIGGIITILGVFIVQKFGIIKKQ